MTVGVPKKGRRRKSPRTTRTAIPPRVLACRSSVKSKYCSVGLGCVPVEQDDQVCVTCVRDELVRDLGHVITGFLWDNRMKPTASRRNNLGGVPACWAWVPLKHRETVSMMHEVTVCIVEVAMPRWFGKPEYRSIGKIVSMGFGNGPTSTVLGTDARWVPARAVLALLFWSAMERVGCGPLGWY